MSQARPLVVRLGASLPNPEPEICLIEEAGGRLQFVEATDPAAVLAAIRDADVVIQAGGVGFPAETIAQLPRCRAIIQASVGYDRIDVTAATARGMMVANLPDYCVEEVSDHAVARLWSSAVAATRLFTWDALRAHPA